MVALTNTAALNTILEIPALTQGATTTGTFVFDETSALAQTVTTITVAARTAVSALWFDMVNVTQDTTIALLSAIDGTNYRQFQENAWVVADDDGVLIDGFITAVNLRVTFTCAGGGAGNVNVPFVIL